MYAVKEFYLSFYFHSLPSLFFFPLIVGKFHIQNTSKELQLSIDLYDEIGIGGGASGVAGGLLHPYSPKGLCLLKIYRTPVLFLKAYLVSPFFKKLYTILISFFHFAVKLLWQGAACWRESLKLLRVAGDADHYKASNGEEGEELFHSSIVRRRFVRIGIMIGLYS